MGQKVHPIGFRIGVIRQPDSKWFADKKQYPALLYEDYQIRKLVKDRLGYGTISRVEIERAANRVNVTLLTSRPGAVIGRGGRGVDELEAEIQKLVWRRDKKAMVRLAVSEIRQPDLDAQLVAENIALQLEKMISHRRALRQAVTRCLRAQGRGIKVMVSGRLGGAEIARTETVKMGKVPLQTLRADIDYGFAEARTKAGVIGVKVWIYKGEILPEKEQEMIRRRETAGAPAPSEALEEREAPEKVPVEEVSQHVDA